MWSKTPYEILQHIFTDSVISKKDLIQLQLTCKQWSSIAQKHLYREIDIVDASLYGDRANDYDKMKERIKLLAQTLLFLNTETRKWVKTIDVDTLIDPDDNADLSQDPTLNLTMVAHLCPNITKIVGKNLSPAFYDAISNLHHSGSLQNVESLIAPSDFNVENGEALTSSYSKAAIALKDTLKDITVFEGVGGNTDSIQFDCLQQFPRVVHLRLEEFSRLHLSRMGDYISNCCSGTKAISIYMGDKTIEMDERNDQSAISPPTQVQWLAINVNGVPIIQSEMVYLMHMFPSLKYLTFEINEYSDAGSAPFQVGTEMVKQFFKYLSLIPRVDFISMWFGVSEGLGLLPHLASLFDVQELYITSLNTEIPDGLAIRLDREIQLEKGTSNASSNEKDTIKTKQSALTIDIDSNDTETALHSALEVFKEESVDHLIIGPCDDYDTTAYQNITEE